MPEISYIEYTIKILCAIIIGFVVGFERQIYSHDAGIKTNMLVCLGSTLFSIMSYSIGGVDIGRISAQIVSGISFVCAGCIVKEKNNIRGLTTAGVLWVTASLGLCIGFGNYKLAFLSVFFMQLVLFIIKKVEHLWRKK
jgi:putative Mg2+ transporter-C (MgtC) family protein